MLDSLKMPSGSCLLGGSLRAPTCPVIPTSPVAPMSAMLKSSWSLSAVLSYFWHLKEKKRNKIYFSCYAFFYMLVFNF